MMEVETLTHRGISYEIAPDFDPQNPREWGDTLGIFVAFHRRDRLGDVCYRAGQEQDFIDHEAKEQLFAAKNKGVFLKVYAYEHSNMILTADYNVFERWPDHRWDCGQIGFVFAHNQQICNWFGVKRITDSIRTKAEQVLRAEIDQYSSYLKGDCYEYRIGGDEGDGWCSGYTYAEARENAEAEINLLLDKVAVAV